MPRLGASLSWAVAVLAFIIGVLAGVLLHRATHANLGELFFAFTLFDIAQLLSAIVLGAFISYSIRARANNEAKRKEAVGELLEAFHERLADLVRVSIDYMESPSKTKERSVLRAFKEMSIFVGAIGAESALSAYCDEKGGRKSLQNAFLELKATVTDSPFGEARPKYKDDRPALVNSLHANFMVRLYKFKTELYSR